MLSYGLGALGLKSEYSIVERTERLGLSFAVITFIPSVSIVVSLIGTFAFMQFMGFSLNLLTLFALVLAIGMVVDDAIIVVEAVQANFDKGYRSPYLASTDAMRSVAMALLTSTIVFMAVFIPVSMIDGTSGAFYRQFGLTMAVAVGISAINAFTLSPVLCALLLRPYTDENGQQRNNFSARFRKAFNAVFSVMSQKYAAIAFRFIRHKYLSFGIIAAAVALLLLLVKATPTSLVSGFGMSSGFDLNLEDRNGGSISQFQQVKDRFVKELSRQPEIGSAYSHHTPWHVAPDGGYGSRSQWQPLISLLCGGWHGVGYPCPVLPRARPVHHLPVVARTADAKENGGVIEVNYSK